MKPRPVLDVAELPAIALGHRAPLWWGMLGLMAIEGTMFAMVLSTWFYLASSAGDWPPPGVQLAPLGPATWLVGLLLASVPPAYWASEASARKDIRGVRFWLLVNLAMALAAIAIRILEWRKLGFSWSDHVYGSIVWVILSLHTTHLMSSTAETVVFTVIAFTPALGDEQRVGIDADSIYWYFVVGAWLPFYFLLFVAPRI